MAKLSHFFKFPVSATRVTVKMHFVSACGGDGPRPSSYTHPGDPREMSVNRFACTLGVMAKRYPFPGNPFRFFFFRKFLPANCPEISPGKSPRKFLPANRLEISSGKLPGNFPREIPPGNFFRKTPPGSFFRKTPPGNFFRKTAPGKFLAGNAPGVCYRACLGFFSSLVRVCVLG